jgi:hypothetical protein
MPEAEEVWVTWYDCDCAFISKYCDENHVSRALVPVAVLNKFTKGD